jgi:hypothetical protein
LGDNDEFGHVIGASVIERLRLTSKGKSRASAAKRTQRLPSVFGAPLLLDGEDAAAYEELVRQICAAVNPVDMIETIFVHDVAWLQWDILQFRRLKARLMNEVVNEGLEKVLPDVLEIDHYKSHFVEIFVETVQAGLTKARAWVKYQEEAKNQGADADENEDKHEDEGKNEEDEDVLTENLRESKLRKLASQYLQGKPDAIEMVTQILNATELEIDDIFENAIDAKRKELARAYARREPTAVNELNKVLAANGLTVYDMLAKGLTERKGGELKIDHVEHIDRLVAMAETRRNMMLREIDRHRAVLGEALRRKMLELDAEDVKVIETPSRQGKRAH